MDQYLGLERIYCLSYLISSLSFCTNHESQSNRSNSDIRLWKPFQATDSVKIVCLAEILIARSTLFEKFATKRWDRCMLKPSSPDPWTHGSPQSAVGPIPIFLPRWNIPTLSIAVYDAMSAATTIPPQRPLAIRCIRPPYLKSGKSSFSPYTR